VSPEFPSDNPELWHVSYVALALLLSEPETEAAAQPESEPEAVMESEPEIENRGAQHSGAIRGEASRGLGEAEPPIEIDVEVVDFSDEDFAVVENESLPPERAKEDVFHAFVRTLVEVALAAGANARVVEMIPAMLGVTRLDTSALDPSVIESLVAGDLLTKMETGAVTRSESLVESAHAWRATLLEEQTEFSVSSMLDEWSAHIVATLLATPQQKEALRRELRARGIAAFGMLVEAA